MSRKALHLLPFSMNVRYSILQLLSLLLGFAIVPGIPNAQVPAQVNLSRGRTAGPEEIRVHWSAGDEAAWQAENGDRLDIMGVRVALSSDSLVAGSQAVIPFRWVLQGGLRLEALVISEAWTPGESLQLVDAQKGIVLFTLDEASRGRIMTPAFYPDQVHWRWNRPDPSALPSRFSIDVLYVEDVARDGRGIGFNTALPCHPNTACRTDSLMQSLANTTVRIRMVMNEGIGWCSGSLVNNTRHDKTPYLLTAYHCQYDFTPFYDQWRFDFQYASPECPNPATEPDYFSLTGCALKASGQASDFLLVLLDDIVPANLPVTFAGWDRRETEVPDTGYLIHHPNADIRKYSSCEGMTTIHPNAISWTEGYMTPAGHHFRVRFTEGGHQPGSSGGPYFNQAGFLVGQLHGGTAGCEAASNTYVGRLSRSWAPAGLPEQRLQDWLDPDGTGEERLPGLLNIDPSDLVTVSGIVRDPLGRPVKNARIVVSGDASESLVTGPEGAFFLAGISRQGNYTLTPEKNDFPLNGLNALDLVAIQKHLLAKDTFDLPWQFIAADATYNSSLAVGDILLILRLLLGKIPAFPTSPSWRFDPPVFHLSDIPPGPVPGVGFTAIKIGDVNGTADPQQ